MSAVMSISTLATEPACSVEMKHWTTFPSSGLQDPEPVSTLPVGGEARSLFGVATVP